MNNLENIKKHIEINLESMIDILLEIKLYDVTFNGNKDLPLYSLGIKEKNTIIKNSKELKTVSDNLERLVNMYFKEDNDKFENIDKPMLIERITHENIIKCDEFKFLYQLINLIKKILLEINDKLTKIYPSSITYRDLLICYEKISYIHKACNKFYDSERNVIKSLISRLNDSKLGDYYRQWLKVEEEGKRNEEDIKALLENIKNVRLPKLNIPKDNK